MLIAWSIVLFMVGIFMLNVSSKLSSQEERGIGSLVVEKVWKLAFMLAALFAVVFIFTWAANMIVYMLVKVLMFILILAMCLFVALFIVRAGEEIWKQKNNK